VADVLAGLTPERAREIVEQCRQCAPIPQAMTVSVNNEALDLRRVLILRSQP